MVYQTKYSKQSSLTHKKNKRSENFPKMYGKSEIDPYEKNSGKNNIVKF